MAAVKDHGGLASRAGNGKTQTQERRAQSQRRAEERVKEHSRRKNRCPSEEHPAGSLERACETSVRGTNLQQQEQQGGRPGANALAGLQAEPVAAGAISATTSQGLHTSERSPEAFFGFSLWAPGSIVNRNETCLEAAHTFRPSGTAERKGCLAWGPCRAEAVPHSLHTRVH